MTRAEKTNDIIPGFLPLLVESEEKTVGLNLWTLRSLAYTLKPDTPRRSPRQEHTELRNTTVPARNCFAYHFAQSRDLNIDCNLERALRLCPSLFLRFTSLYRGSDFFRDRSLSVKRRRVFTSRELSPPFRNLNQRKGLGQEINFFFHYST